MEVVTEEVSRQWEDDSSVPEKWIDITLQNDQILQRYLARRIWKEREFLVTLTNGERTLGFITGIDERGIQMSTSEANPNAVFLYHTGIVKIEATKRRISSLPYEWQEKIRMYAHALQLVCSKALTGTSNGQKRDDVQDDFEKESAAV